MATNDAETASSVRDQFAGFRDELDLRHDLWERVVRAGRDVTVDSKRLIFALHRFLDCESDRERGAILADAERQQAAVVRKLHGVAALLVDEDPYRFVRAYSPGVQEFVEAAAFLRYLQREGELAPASIHRAVLTYQDVQALLTFEAVTLPVPVIEYLLGIADTTGEAMRMCVQCAALDIGRADRCRSSKLCAYVRLLHALFASFSSALDLGPGRGKCFAEKVRTMRQSVAKCEEACYTARVRGQEFPDGGTLLRSELALPASFACD